MSDTDYGPEGKRFFRQARRELLPKLRDSAIFLSLFSEDPDPKFCMELGMAIALDKPILLLVPKGRTLDRDSHLWRVADEVIWNVDFDHPERDQQRVQDAITLILAERGLLP